MKTFVFLEDNIDESRWYILFRPHWETRDSCWPDWLGGTLIADCWGSVDVVFHGIETLRGIASPPRGEQHPCFNPKYWNISEYDTLEELVAAHLEIFL